MSEQRQRRRLGASRFPFLPPPASVHTASNLTPTPQQLEATLNECARQLCAASVCEEDAALEYVAKECGPLAEKQLWLHAKTVEAAAIAMDAQRKDVMRDLGDFHATHEILVEHWHGLQAGLQSCVGDLVAHLTSARGEVNQRRQEAENTLDSKIDALRQAGSKDQLATFKKIIKVAL